MSLKPRKDARCQSQSNPFDGGLLAQRSCEDLWTDIGVAEVDTAEVPLAAHRYDQISGEDATLHYKKKEKEKNREVGEQTCAAYRDLQWTDQEGANRTKSTLFDLLPGAVSSQQY